ncbi:MAG: VTT domain-containing protein, partial [Wenzhouxiangellaceae bacterium]
MAEVTPFQVLLQWAEGHPILILIAGFVLAFIESLALVGVIVPGVLMLFVLGALVGLDPWLLTGLAVTVALGAITGDGVSFWLGRRYGAGMRSVWPMRHYQHWLDAGEAYFSRHGGKSIVIARFIGPLRPVVPLVAGSLKMPVGQFVPRMVPACVIWSPLMLLPGALFGESLEFAARFGGRLTLLLAILVIGGWLLLWLTRRVYEFGARRAPWWLKNLALWLRRHPLLGRCFGPLFEPGRREVLSVMILGLMLVISLASLFAALLLAPFSTDAWEAGFELSGLAASMRNHFADPLFFALAISASIPVLFGLILAMTLLLSIQRRWVALGHWWMACLGGWLLALLLNALMGLLLGRPTDVGSISEVPHTGLTLTLLVPGFAALMLAKDFQPRQRKWLYLVTTGLIALLAFAEFYLARTTLNGMIAAIALAGGWLAVVGIGYRRRAGPVRGSGLMALAFLLIWMGVSAVMIGNEYQRFAEEHRLDPPQRSETLDWWWREGWRELPERRSRIGRLVDQRFDAQLAGKREVLLQALSTRGWEHPPEAFAGRLRARLAREIDTRKLGHAARE